MPWAGKGPPAASVIAEAAIGVFRRCGKTLPCTRIAVSATGFTEITADQGTLTSFFEAGASLIPAAATADADDLLHAIGYGLLAMRHSNA